jgi:hypothetical protein
MSAWDRIDQIQKTQAAPKFLYFNHRFARGEYRWIQVYKVDTGYGYLLRNISYTWYGYLIPLMASAVELGEAPQLELFVRRASRQNDPIPLDTISSPGGGWDNNLAIFPLIMATSPKSHKFENVFFQFGDTIEFHVVRHPNALDPLITGIPFIYGLHMVFKGYDTPEPQSRIW